MIAQVDDALSQLEGAFSLLITVGDTLYAARDRHGFRPLVVGYRDGGYVVASDTHPEGALVRLRGEGGCDLREDLRHALNRHVRAAPGQRARGGEKRRRRPAAEVVALVDVGPAVRVDAHRVVRVDVPPGALDFDAVVVRVRTHLTLYQQRREIGTLRRDEAIRRSDPSSMVKARRGV